MKRCIQACLRFYHPTAVIASSEWVTRSMIAFYFLTSSTLVHRLTRQTFYFEFETFTALIAAI